LFREEIKGLEGKMIDLEYITISDLHSEYMSYPFEYLYAQVNFSSKYQSFVDTHWIGVL
jgi:hypothetical protein